MVGWATATSTWWLTAERIRPGAPTLTAPSRGHGAFYQASLGEVRVGYSPKSYIGIRRGRRVWAPLWPRRDGAFIYLDPDGLHGEQQSPVMDVFQERLREDGLETNWQPTYNAGANPVSIRLRQTDLDKLAVQDLLRATFEILGQGVAPWSERQAEPVADPPAATTAEFPAHNSDDAPPAG